MLVKITDRSTIMYLEDPVPGRVQTPAMGLGELLGKPKNTKMKKTKLNNKVYMAKGTTMLSCGMCQDNVRRNDTLAQQAALEQRLLLNENGGQLNTLDYVR